MISPSWRCGRFTLDLSQPQIMGIVNVTPDSFSDGGRHATTDRAIAHGLRLIAEGAHLLDLGGESTRPGAAPVSVADEIARVVPVIEGLRHANVPLSIDTFKPEVMAASLAAGADIINDIRGFDSDAALDAVAAHPECGLVVMHMQGAPQTMQANPHYHDVVAEVQHFLLAQATRLGQRGFQPNQIVLDPGLGFGKTTAHNLALLHAVPQLRRHGHAVLIGGSRKSLIGQITGRPVAERVPGSLALALNAAHRGARIIRVHDVAATCDALAVWHAIEAAAPAA